MHGVMHQCKHMRFHNARAPQDSVLCGAVAEQCEEHKKAVAKEAECAAAAGRAAAEAVAQVNHANQMLAAEREAAQKHAAKEAESAAAAAAAMAQVNRANQQLVAEREAAQKDASETCGRLEREIASLQAATADLTSELTNRSEELESTLGSLSALQEKMQEMHSTEDLALATQVLARALQAKLVERAAEKGLHRVRFLLLLRSWMRWQVTTRLCLRLNAFKCSLSERSTLRVLRHWRERAVTEGRCRRVVARSVCECVRQAIAQVTCRWRQHTSRELKRAGDIRRVQLRRTNRTRGTVLDALRGMHNRALLLSKTHFGMSLLWASWDFVRVRQSFHLWWRMVMRVGWRKRQCVKTMRVSASLILRHVWLEWLLLGALEHHQLLLVSLEQERNKARESEKQARHQTGRLENVEKDAKVLSSTLLRDVEHQRHCLLVAAGLQEKSAEILREKSEEVEKLKTALLQRSLTVRKARDAPEDRDMPGYRLDAASSQDSSAPKRPKQEIVSISLHDR